MFSRSLLSFACRRVLPRGDESSLWLGRRDRTTSTELECLQSDSSDRRVEPQGSREQPKTYLPPALNGQHGAAHRSTPLRSHYFGPGSEQSCIANPAEAVETLLVKSS